MSLTPEQARAFIHHAFSKKTVDATMGGPISGPGTATSDSIPARLSDGEYVIPAHVVKALGRDFFDRLLAQHKRTA